MPNGNLIPLVIEEVPEGQRPVWVFHHHDTGVIVKIMFREPVQADAPKSGKIDLFKTYLSAKALSKPHLLQVKNGKVVIVAALGGL